MELLFENIYYINMDQDVDKRRAMEAKLHEYFRDEIPIIRIPASDGKDVYTSRINTLYKNPENGKNITIGEVGCALSHVEVWENIVESGKTALVLEDDAVCHSSNVLQDIKALSTDRMMLREWDLFYLGRKPLFAFAEETCMWMNQLVKPKYSWHTHAYILTPQGAAKLLATHFQQSIIIADEYIPIMCGDGLDKFDEYGKYPKLDAIALPADKQLFFQENSDSTTKNSPEVFPPNKSPYERQYLHVTAASDENNPGYKDLIKSINKQDSWFYVNIGKEDWKGGTMEYMGGAQKLFWMKDWVDRIDPEAIVIFTDAYDVLILDSAANIIREWLDWFDEDKILFAAESTIWPPLKEREKGETVSRTNGTYPYLNSGCYMGKAKNIAYMISEIFSRWYDITEASDDQLLCQRFQRARPDLVQLDTEARIFQCLGNPELELEARNNRPWNIATETFPMIVHGNGPGKELLHQVRDIFLFPDMWIGPKTL